MKTIVMYSIDTQGDPDLEHEALSLTMGYNPQKQKLFGVPNNFSMCERVLRPKYLRIAILHCRC